MKNHLRIPQLLVIIFLFGLPKYTTAQLVVDVSTDYNQLVDSFAFSGVSVSNINFIGSEMACGYFSNGNSTNLGIESGIILSTGPVADVNNGVAYYGAFNLGTSGYSLLTMLAGADTYDAAVLEFDIIPDDDTLSFSFIYGSEDYPEWVGGNPFFQDHVGVFISGANPDGGNYTDQNFAFVPNTNLPVIANNINSSTNSQYFVENTTGSIMYDGFTTLLDVKIPVINGATYHLSIAIADGGDQISDSGIFLKSQSLSSFGNITSLSELDRQDLFKAYPNPATDNIIFNTTEIGTLAITNHLGQFISGRVINEQQTHININDFQSGVYFLTFQTDKYSATKKMIIQK